MTATSTGETVTIPKKYVSQLLTTIVRDINRAGDMTKRTADAVRWTFSDVAGPHVPAGPEDLWTLPAEVLWALRCGSDALRVYRLDEADADSYGHPAVVAEINAGLAVAEQAPKFMALEDQVMASIGTTETGLPADASSGVVPPRG